MIYINPNVSDVDRDRSRAVLDLLMAKSIKVSKMVAAIIEKKGFPHIGGLENIVGPPMSWLGNCTGKNYMGSEKINPLEFITHHYNPEYQAHTVKQKIGGLLRRCYRLYLSPFIKQQQQQQQQQTQLDEEEKDFNFHLDLENDPSTIRDVFCSFKRCREALQKGRLDSLMVSIINNYRRLICDLGFSMFLFLWDQSHMVKAEHPALQRVPLFHSEHIIDKDNPLFSSYTAQFSKDFREDRDATEQPFTQSMKKIARQCIMDSWNIETKPYENIRHFVYREESQFLPVETDIPIDEDASLSDKNSTHFSRFFGMSMAQLMAYDTEKRSKIICMPEFTILQTVVLRAVVCHELHRILSKELRKSNVGLYIHAFSNTLCDISFQLLCQSSSVEEFTDTYLEQCGIYDMLYPHGKRYSISHDLVDMTNLLSGASIWRDVKTGKANEISKLEHMFLGKMLHQKCKIRNVRKMISDKTAENPIMTYLMIDNIFMTISGGYPVCGVRPSLPAQISIRQMAQAFSNKPYSYFLDWVETNRRMVFSSGKEFFFYQLGFIPPIRNLMIDTMMFEEHEKGMRSYLDKFRMSVERFSIDDTVNYMEGYEPDIIRETLLEKFYARRVLNIYPQDNSSFGDGDYMGSYTNDIELRLQLVAAGPNSTPTEDSEYLRNQTCFVNTICDKASYPMLELQDMGDESHKQQQDNYNKLVKKPFSDQIATTTRTLIPQGLSNEEKEKFVKKTISEWNDAMIMVWLEQEVLAGRIILCDDWTEWEKARPGCVKRLRTKKQKIKRSCFLSFHAIKTLEWEWDRKYRRPRLIRQAFDDYFDQLAMQRKMLRKGKRGFKKVSPEVEAFQGDIKLSAETASNRTDGWYDFMTWMRIIGVSRFGRQMLKTLYFQYEKCEIPDNRFGTYIQILFSLRPRDFQIIREFAACFEDAPNLRVISLGPSVAKNQLEALRKRFGLEPLEPPPRNIGLSYYCACCGNWADIKMSPESKGFKMYGIGLEDAVLDCLTDTLHCKRQGTAMCQSDEPLRTIDTIGVAVSVGDKKPVTRCASCGALTTYSDGNFTELGPTCGGHEVPENVVSKRPGNQSIKKNLISFDEVTALDTLRKHRIFTETDKRKASTSCYYCSKDICTRPHKIKTIRLCYDPRPYEPMVASFRAWMDHSVVGDNRFPITTRVVSEHVDCIHQFEDSCECYSVTPDELKAMTTKGAGDSDTDRLFEELYNSLYGESSDVGRDDLDTLKVNQSSIIIIPCEKHRNPDIPSDRSSWHHEELFHIPDKRFVQPNAKPKSIPLRPTPHFITVPLCDPCFRACKFWLRKIIIPTNEVFMKWMSRKMKQKHLNRSNAISSTHSIQLHGGGSAYVNYSQSTF